MEIISELNMKDALGLNVCNMSSIVAWGELQHVP